MDACRNVEMDGWMGSMPQRTDRNTCVSKEKRDDAIGWESAHRFRWKVVRGKGRSYGEGRDRGS